MTPVEYQQEWRGVKVTSPTRLLGYIDAVLDGPGWLFTWVDAGGAEHEHWFDTIEDAKTFAQEYGERLVESVVD